MQPRKPRVPRAELERQAVEALQAGKLPALRVGRFSGGFGSGTQCALCEHTVRPEHLSAEVTLPEGWLEMHAECFHAWQSAVPPGAPAAEEPGSGR